MQKSDCIELQNEFQNEYNLAIKIGQEWEAQQKGMGCMASFGLCETEGKVMVIDELIKLLENGKRITKNVINHIKNRAIHSDIAIDRLKYNCNGMIKACDLILERFFPIKPYKPHESTLRKKEYETTINENRSLMLKIKNHSDFEYIIADMKYLFATINLQILKRKDEINIIGEKNLLQILSDTIQLSQNKEELSNNYNTIYGNYNYIQSSLLESYKNQKQNVEKIKNFDQKIKEFETKLETITTPEEKLDVKIEMKELIYQRKKFRLGVIHDYLSNILTTTEREELSAESMMIFKELYH